MADFPYNTLSLVFLLFLASMEKIRKWIILYIRIIIKISSSSIVCVWVKSAEAAPANFWFLQRAALYAF